MKIAINKAHFPVTVLGPGRRIGLWLQGCSIGCKGCVSQDTWARDPGREMTVARLLSWCRQTTGGVFDGVTISGGEPFDQPQALAVLLDALIDWRAAAKADFDILCYSGYPLARLQKKHAKLLGKLDALIPEPYLDHQPLTHLWRGSANQPLVLLSERGRRRIGDYVDAGADSAGKRMQAMVDGERVWYVGIPARGDMAALEAACTERGVAFGQVSWRQ
ncbi:MAG: 4Fe-4S single cluster domain-containing protein [Rhodoferax sp.]|nr:4Fe-4S single cluster domain-containing protein [Rhodoferax sp.]MDP3650351.1 4Fe-4S single cluster domain-containing protein [Rhodoferax sp.]